SLICASATPGLAYWLNEPASSRTVDFSADFLLVLRPAAVAVAGLLRVLPRRRFSALPFFCAKERRAASLSSSNRVSPATVPPAWRHSLARVFLTSSTTGSWCAEFFRVFIVVTYG